MVFSSLIFLFCFLPAVIGIYYILPRKLRNIFLLLASVFFYAWGDARYLPVMFTTITVSYIGALVVEKVKYKRIFLSLFIILDLSLLFYFKYTNFLLENLNLIFHKKWSLDVVLPLGISFYTFQTLSYMIDVYRGEVKAQTNFLNIALYICSFPQLISGPIVKYHDISEQIISRKETLDNVYYGIKRFIIGLAKKVLIANTLGAVADKIFDQSVKQFDCLTSWLGAFAYTFQIFFDFSGYSDMAIGLGAIFGFKFLENFNYPYISKSVSEFWRRWHISLSTWFKEYLYIPLGGNRVSKLRNCLNLFIVFLITGLWHGASWNFVAWGLWNGFFIIFEKLTGWSKKEGGYIIKTLQHIYCIFVFVFGWVLFRSENLTYAFNYMKNMFGLFGTHKIAYILPYYIDNLEIIAFAVAIICSTPLGKKIVEYTDKKAVLHTLFNGWLLILFVVSEAFIASSTYNPFIYFRF